MAAPESVGRGLRNRVYVSPGLYAPASPQARRRLRPAPMDQDRDRSGLPLDPPSGEIGGLLFHSWPAPGGASHEPGGIRSLSASLRSAGRSSPPDPPLPPHPLTPPPFDPPALRRPPGRPHPPPQTHPRPLPPPPGPPPAPTRGSAR